jgi:hypothetical protein
MRLGLAVGLDAEKIPYSPIPRTFQIVAGAPVTKPLNNGSGMSRVSFKMSNFRIYSWPNFLERWLPRVCAAVALIICVTGVGRFVRLDEANSVIIASSSWRHIVEYLQQDNNLPLYYLMLHGWIAVAGIAEWSVHLPSVVFFLLAVVVTYGIGLEVSRNRLAAIYSAFFYLASSQAIHQAQKARMYSLLGFLAAVSTLLFVRIWLTESTRSPVVRHTSYALYILINAAGTFVHVWYFFLLFAQLTCGLILQPKKLRSLLLALGVAVAPFAILWSRFLPHQASIGATDWMPRTHLRFFVGAFCEFYGGIPWGCAFIFVVILLCTQGARHVRRWEEWPRRQAFALAIIAVLCLTVPLLISYVRPIYWPGRYTMIALPALATLLGCSLTAFVDAEWRVVFAYCTLASLLVIQVRTRRQVFENSAHMYLETESDKDATLQLCRWTGQTDTLVFTGLTRAGVEYYIRRFDCRRNLKLVSFPVDTVEHLGWVRHSNPETLSAEAEEIAYRFSQEDDNSRLWVILGQEGGADQKLLIQLLNEQLVLSNQYALQGSLFNKVLVYIRKGRD